jgi:hypothetical protein
MMKKISADCDLNDDLRPEYPAEFFRDMKPNRFAGTELITKEALRSFRMGMWPRCSARKAKKEERARYEEDVL